MFEVLHPINAAGLVLNGAMMLCLVIVISVGRRKLKARKRRKSGRALTLLTEPRQCLVFFRRLHSGIPATLPALTKEDHL
jgi:hypothetical protein